MRRLIIFCLLGLSALTVTFCGDSQSVYYERLSDLFKRELESGLSPWGISKEEVVAKEKAKLMQEGESGNVFTLLYKLKPLQYDESEAVTLVHYIIHKQKGLICTDYVIMFLIEKREKSDVVFHSIRSFLTKNYGNMIAEDDELDPVLKTATWETDNSFVVLSLGTSAGQPIASQFHITFFNKSEYKIVDSKVTPI